MYPIYSSDESITVIPAWHVLLGLFDNSACNSKSTVRIYGHSIAGMQLQSSVVQICYDFTAAVFFIAVIVTNCFII